MQILELTEEHVEVYSEVLANEKTCRMMLKRFLMSGVIINVDPDSLTHEEVIEVNIQIIKQVYLREIEENKVKSVH